jgi:hypothetical protein
MPPVLPNFFHGPEPRNELATPHFCDRGRGTSGIESKQADWQPSRAGVSRYATSDAMESNHECRLQDRISGRDGLCFCAEKV